MLESLAQRLTPSATNLVKALRLKLATSFGGGHLAAQLMHIALTDSGYRLTHEIEALRIEKKDVQ